MRMILGRWLRAGAEGAVADESAEQGGNKGGQEEWDFIAAECGPEDIRSLLPKGFYAVGDRAWAEAGEA